ncbi:MAG: molybdate ABC transporter substrate-binding protein [Paenibacillaceae bacterium]
MVLKKLILTGLTLLLLIGCTPQHMSTPQKGSSIEAELLVSAAASLANSLDEIGLLFEQQNSGITVAYNYGSSGALQHQIEQGAPVDLFLSAGKKQMANLVEAGFIDQEKSVTLLGNELVVIVPASELGSWDDLSPFISSSIQMIAIGELHTVPAGEYARSALVASGIWDKLNNKIVYAKDVSQVLSYVETGNVDAGIVYKSVAMSSSKVKIAFSIDAKTHDIIEYPLGIVNTSRNQEAAKVYYDFLQSLEVLEIFKKYGFTTK